LASVATGGGTARANAPLRVPLVFPIAACAMNTIDRARAYLAKLPPAIAGSGGHAATFKAACVAVKFGLNESDAWELLCEWNATHCQPQWTENELRHKLADARRVTTPKEQFNHPPQTPGSSQMYNVPARWENLSVRAADAKTKRATADFSASFFDQSPTERQFSALASLRGISIEGVRLAYERGLLRFGQHQGRAAWFILDGSRRVAQARRMDGQLWTANAKAWTLRNSQAAWPVGVEESALFATVAFCEGSPDLLAAHHFIWTENREHDCAAVAIFGGANIHADALRLFEGKRVRIFRHVDATGDAATNRWAKQINDAGADVDAFNFAGIRQADGSPVEDLNDCARVHADDFETHRCLWNLLP